MWGRDVPGRRIHDRIIEQRGLAGWVISRQLLARRMLRGPLLAQIVGPAPARRGIRSRTVFRPRLIAADPEAQRERPLWINSADDAPANDEWQMMMPASVVEELPESADSITPAAASLDERAEVEHTAPPVRVSAVTPPPEQARPAAVVQPIPQRALPPRERMGRRVEERVQEIPSQVAAAPISTVSAPTPSSYPSVPTPPQSERAGAVAPPPVERPLPNLSEPYRAETTGAVDTVHGAVSPTPDALPLPVTEIVEALSTVAERPSAPTPPDSVAENLPGEPPALQRESVVSLRAASVQEDYPETATIPRGETEGTALDASPASLAVSSPIAPPESHEQPALPEPDLQRKLVPPEVETPQPAQQAGAGEPTIPAPSPVHVEAASAAPPVMAAASEPETTPGISVATPLPLLAARPVAPTAADLFASGGEDRSPAAWLARLNAAAQPQSQPVAAPAPTLAPPVPSLPGAQGTSTPSRTPFPRFIAPMQVRVPYATPVETTNTRNTPVSVPEQPGVALPAEDDAPMIAPTGASGTAPQTETAEDGEIVAADDRMPDTLANIQQESVAAAPPEAGRDTGQTRELFASPGADRTPMMWLERLRRAEGAPAERTPPAPTTREPLLVNDPPTASAPISQMVTRPRFIVPSAAGREDASSAPSREPSVGRAPLPLSESSRRFLQPLVGIDPGEVPVHVGPEANTVAAAYRADALTDGNVVMLGAGHVPDSPETLGLIAHELTHIVRRRDPRFIPPIARGEHRAAPALSVAGAQTETEEIAPLADDEMVARRVESQVARAARTADSDQPREQSALAGDENRPAGASTPAQASTLAQSSTDGRVGESAGNRWGGLPAPWEPLPVWMAPSAPESPAMPANVTPLPLAAPTQLAPVAPVAQLAEQGREGGGESAAPETPAPQQQEAHAPAAPDLDALARQVYDLLKRRLALERRNFG